ncbi:M23 family metallopeptidase [Brevibacillus choshinensis]|uniref:M23 family metallopeptidase n=1 Tax=Brevibacillus choshinensis TaxID=54911 RepID=A0ABX7FT46_BRECH|nr:M23 family metallopeptidase [Brevibacillus choshinensis]QRG69406.1 M23 family metallopeptidase [Brevibacillus choshinensis]
MFRELDRVKERRRERLERIRMQPRDSFSPFVDDWKDPIEPTAEPFGISSLRDEDPVNPRHTHETWGIQILVSILLVGVSYLLFQTSLIPVTWKDSAREVMTRDFNFAGVADWYEARFGSLPTLLPSLHGPNAVPAAGTTTKEAAVWKLPASWKVVKTFEPERSAKVVLNTGMEDPVTIGETGWVTYIGDKPGYGTTVVVRLTKGREVWFGNMERVTVVKDDVVQAGQEIGIARAVNNSSRHLYLGVKSGDQFVNPLDVIPFE